MGEISGTVSNHNSTGGLSAPVFSLAEGGSMLGVSQAVDDFLSLQGSTQGTVPEEQGDDGQENKEDSPIFRQTYTKEDSPIFGPTSSQNSGNRQPTEESHEVSVNFPGKYSGDTTPSQGKNTANFQCEEAQNRLAEDMNDSSWASIKPYPTGQLRALPTLTYALGKERFGLEKKPNLRKKPLIPNRRLGEIKKIRAKLRSLRKRYRCSSDAEKEAQHREKAKKRMAFTSNPYKYTRSLLSEEKSGKLESSQDEVEQYLRETHSDPHRSETLAE
ncbi:hypothetical protein MAR_009348, partial [Mya arenaria]